MRLIELHLDGGKIVSEDSDADLTDRLHPIEAPKSFVICAQYQHSLMQLAKERREAEVRRLVEVNSPRRANAWLWDRSYDSCPSSTNSLRVNVQYLRLDDAAL
jgi:hypothetical protein